VLVPTLLIPGDVDVLVSVPVIPDMLVVDAVTVTSVVVVVINPVPVISGLGVLVSVTLISLVDEVVVVPVPVN